ncbi:hypothetical protein [Paraburkholderia aromaticivorans]|uniref:hypothetical protein n=1 Tax=Paraburkholderia aromaticivorans TaxID=2026199 RepID=UPI0012FE1D5D|nr:hypothetical protein [Paraburkholderia aromaticivorans]
MKVINKTIDELKELNSKATPVSMLAMDSGLFEKLLASLHGKVNHYLQERESNYRSDEIVILGDQLLCKVVEHHVLNNVPATQVAADIFNETVQLILKIINLDFNINSSKYDKAHLISISLRALKACGITPPLHTKERTWEYPGHEGKKVDEEALRYAANNTVEFTRFVYEVASKNAYVPDPLHSAPHSQMFSLFARLYSLAFPSGIPIPGH